MDDASSSKQSENITPRSIHCCTLQGLVTCKLQVVNRSKIKTHKGHWRPFWKWATHSCISQNTVINLLKFVRMSSRCHHAFRTFFLLQIALKTNCWERCILDSFVARIIISTRNENYSVSHDYHELLSPLTLLVS